MRRTGGPRGAPRIDDEQANVCARTCISKRGAGGFKVGLKSFANAGRTRDFGDSLRAHSQVEE
jgi:hypothetical protein